MRHARPDELAGVDAVHDYVALYPSGRRIVLRGRFAMVVAAGAACPAVRDGEQLYLLDPRAVVVRDDLIIHDPRSRPGAAWVRAWLNANPSWPRIATEAAL